MENRNGKWVNVDYANRVLDESYAAAPPRETHEANEHAPHVDTLAPGDNAYADDDDALFYAGNEHGYGYGYSQSPYANDDDDNDTGHNSDNDLGSHMPHTTTHESAYGTSLLSARQQLQQRHQSELDASSAIEISVSEPVKQGDGMNAFIAYKITTTTRRPQFAHSQFTVVRRYSDFVWLHANLQALFPGVVVPPLPEKLLVGRFSPEFIEARRRALQLFLHRCVQHPEVQHSSHITTFLEASDDALAAFRNDPLNCVATNTRSSLLFQWLDDTVATISAGVAGSSSDPGMRIPKTPADALVEDMIAYIDGLEPIVSGLYKHAHGLTKRAREVADGLFEFGVAFTLLGKSEDNASLQAGLQAIGACSDRLAALAAEHAEREALRFEAPIADYIRLVSAVKQALTKRNEVRTAYSSAVVELESKTLAVSKLRKHKGHNGNEKVQIAESDVVKATQRVEDAKLEFDIVTERVLREVERFRQEKFRDFQRILLDYIQLQIAYSKQVEDTWKSVMPQLTQIQIETQSPTASSSTAPIATMLMEGDQHDSSSNVAVPLDLLSLSHDEEEDAHAEFQYAIAQQQQQQVGGMQRPPRHTTTDCPDVSI